jgi:heterogeneous nuclear ribonucleoprotein U-like protein 1
MDKATAMFNVILSRAANVPRNYIIDQTNVYKNARRRKLKPFADYQKVSIYLFVCWSLEDEYTIVLAI